MFICFIFIVFSCTKKLQSKDDTLVIIEHDKIEDSGKDSTLIFNVEYVPLSTTNESLIGKACRVIFRNENFYVFDFIINNSVLVFDRYGDFSYKIENIGKGPGEYISASDFDVDSDGNVFLFDAGGSRSILHYTNEGKEWTYIKPSKGFIEFKFVDKNNILAYLPFSGKGIEDCYGLINLKSDGYRTIIGKREMIDEDQNFYELSHIFRSDNAIYFSPRYTNTIFKFENNFISEKYRFSKDVLPPEEYIDDLINGKVLFRENQKYILSISGIYETENVVAITYKLKTTKQILISKHTNKIYSLDNVQNCHFWNNNYIICGSTGDSFIAIVSDLYMEDIMNSCLEVEEKAELAIRTQNSNPALVLFKVKDF